mmetsp:Transcript_26649/g.80461  ORF Transcript_26649/g.80461 Transcript_26649/m.80461 type:complete len:271 (-) Transcript_26649:957-1769(-)
MPFVRSDGHRTDGLEIISAGLSAIFARRYKTEAPVRHFEGVDEEQGVLDADGTSRSEAGEHSRRVLWHAGNMQAEEAGGASRPVRHAQNMAVDETGPRSASERQERCIERTRVGSGILGGNLRTGFGKPPERGLVLRLGERAVRFLAHEPQVSFRMIRSIVVVGHAVKAGEQIRRGRGSAQSVLAPQHRLLVLARRHRHIHYRVVRSPTHGPVKVPRMFDERRSLPAHDQGRARGDERGDGRRAHPGERRRVRMHGGVGAHNHTIRSSPR